MNELIIADKIEKQLREPNKIKVFPLTPTHRKELRQLRDSNIGNLKHRLRTITKLKRDEYEEKYSKEIEKQLGKYQKNVHILNQDWKKTISKINEILNIRKKIEEQYNIDNFSLEKDYTKLGGLEEIKTIRKFSLDEKNKAQEIARKQFKEKYGDKFEAINQQIEKIVTQYEEAINFGDLEIVKKLYYIMKGSDEFFNKINELKI